MRTHKDLDVWKGAIVLTKAVYEISEKFPKREDFALTSQMRRAAVSVASNIAEGAGRYSKKEFERFLYISLGSLSELDTQLIIARELDYIRDDVLKKFDLEIKLLRKMMFGLIKSLKIQN
jgi:four helix bundle protein